MKQVWFTLGISSLLLTGCTGMMYGNNTAPVNNHNIYQGNTVPLDTTTSNHNGVFSQSTQGNIQAQPVNRQEAPSQTTPYGQNPTLAQTAAQQGQAPNSSYTPVQQPSPYGQPVNPSNANDDGWSVRPVNGQDNSGQSADNTPVDQPKVDNDPAPQDDKPQAIRPPQRNDQDNANTAQTQPEDNNPQPADNAGAENSQDDKQVASAAPTQPANDTSNSGETAVSSLLKKASASLGKGDLDGAVGYLENAQRIEPQNSKILYDIANIRYHQGRHREAESFASRAVQVGGSDSMMKKSWSLIANARKALGDNQGAITAAEKATSL